MNVIDSLFTTEFQGDGSSSSITLSNYASRFIADIECLFGPRDRSFTLIGIVIDRTPGNLPQLWFPDSGIPPGDVEGRSKHVVIRLSRNALTDSARARWQLAHECVHALDPWNLRVDGRPASCGSLLKKRLRPYFASNRQADRLTFKDAFRHAAKHDLISMEACERWFAYRDNRNDTAHDYGERFAETTLKLLPDFITDARELARVISEGGDD